jgi:hypothetical protein
MTGGSGYGNSVASKHTFEHFTEYRADDSVEYAGAQIGQADTLVWSVPSR